MERWAAVMGLRWWSPFVRRVISLKWKSMEVEWEAHEQADRMSCISTLPLKAREATSVNLVSPGIG